MAWTTPALCGAASLVSSGDAAFSGYVSITQIDTAGAWGSWPFTDTNVTGDTIRLTNWNIEIPGAGANVSRMKITVQGHEDIPTSGYDLSVSGNGITITSKDVAISGQIWATDTMDFTVAEWGISAAEIDSLVSNSASYGLQVDMDAGDWSNSSARFRNFYLSFEYTKGRIYIT